MTTLGPTMAALLIAGVLSSEDGVDTNPNVVSHDAE
jgi:hypothetical protein